MLPRDKSGTTSSRFPTNSLETSVQFLKGVGPRLGTLLGGRGLGTVGEILRFFPRDYEDRSKLQAVGDAQAGDKVSLPLRVVSKRLIPIRRLGKTILEVKATDGARTVGLKWFNAPRGMDVRFNPGQAIIATGKVTVYQGQTQLVHPEVSWGGPGAVQAGSQTAPTERVSEAPWENHPGLMRVVPIYVEVEGLSTQFLRRILWEATQKFAAHLPEDLPEALLARYGLPRASQAVQAIHFPPQKPEYALEKLAQFSTPSHARMIYEEFLKFEYLVLRQRLKMERLHAPVFGRSPEGQAALEDLRRSLPFTLTGDQQKAVADVLGDLGAGSPMNRLIQGDVGSGKTAVMFLASGAVLAEGGQVALMAPTEILVEQHYRNALKLFGGKLRCELLTGSTPASVRAKLLPRLAAGEPMVLMGTHALLEDPVVFKNLGLVCIDEQHRFGVEQRRTLRGKGRRAGESGKTLHTHQLVLTATPIPRTLALTAYGDVAVTSIQELPPGRMPITTRVIREKGARTQAMRAIRAQLAQGRQAYFVFPLVNESEAEGFTELKSAVAEAERLQREELKGFKVALLHGQMRPDEKAAVMAAFKAGTAQVLVSTTVIEVGVDVPNATIMAVEHAERFGLSQLHQLRGRVGRGTHASHCYLFAPFRSGEATTQRLEVLEETQDGFKIAEADLEIRGPGEFLGTRQAGDLPFKMGNLVRDRDWLLRAREDAASLLKEDPELLSPANRPLRVYFEREGKIQFDRLKTS